MKAPASRSPRTTAKNRSGQSVSRQSASWKASIENDDAHKLWRSLYRLVSIHPLVRSTLQNQQGTSQPAPILSLQDLTQDLYLLLLRKGRFHHYLINQMTDVEIEREIFQIELTNLMIGSLRRRRPENYRIVRRVSGALERDPHFRRFKQVSGQIKRYRQAADAIFGLREWGNDKLIKDSGTFSDLIEGISIRRRNRRRTGCTGEAQVIVSNQELVELLIEIFEAIDSPAPLRVVRQLALSKLPVYDPMMTSIDDEINDEHQSRGAYDHLASADAGPEDIALMVESQVHAHGEAVQFLERLGSLVRYNSQRTARLWRIFWHFYFDPSEPSQLEIAEIVGISDSSVSDYRRKLETELKKLNFSIDSLKYFTEELEEQLRWRLSIAESPLTDSSFAPEIDWPKIPFPGFQLAV